ncbi:hypothetical protein [Vitiosangium sp. GDMCC 1.1324]|uniref:hypothetical protein n=1 Tax=Vitiosangium sp. (strain GDMCC 1.1324) TaxID=2138576 RepID=UPI00130DAF9D|nr:hypothetical protein [Vitiosangium sp. GDMCC 1.1324]
MIGGLLLLAACSNKATDSAVALTVKYQGYAPVCLRVTAMDATAPERKSSEFLKQSKLAADEDRTLILAVYREKTWSPQLQIEVASYATPDCTGDAIETRVLPSAVTLPAKGSVPSTLALLAQDVDKDGYPAITLSDSAIHGLDCNDGKDTVHPGAVAVCDGSASLNTDFNCDGKVDCNGSTCSNGAMCGSGYCVGGFCCDSACDAPNQCQSAGTCGTGTCVYKATPNAPCDDKSACTTNDKCNAQGVCTGTAKVCNTRPAQCFSDAGTCNASTGACEYPPLPGTTTCNDGNRCTDNDMCNGSGVCAGTAKTCNTRPDQCYSDVGTCNGSTGNCDYPPLPNTTACNDGQACTDNDKCNGSGACVGTAKVCNTPSTDCYAKPGTCNTTSGVCEYSPLPNTASCNDGKSCTTDKCDGSGNCIGTMNCPPPNECKIAGACAADGSCQFVVDTTKVGKVCHEAGSTGTCQQDGTCLAFKYAVTSNFDPADVATNNTIDDLSILCATTLDSSGTPTWTFPGGCSFATPTPVVTAGDVVVIPIRNLTVNAPLRVVGTRPVVLAVYGNATVNQEIRANSVRTETQVGSGSGVRCGTGSGGGAGANGTGTGDADWGGGGGGGLLSKGGDGGDADHGGGTAGQGGSVLSSTGFSPLVGGCAGGQGGTPASGPTPGAGGAGGGSLQLSVAGTLTLREVVSVSGAGGKGGRAATGSATGGGGGGSGGMLVLEADNLVVEAGARLTANGGAGGEGSSELGALFHGNDGADGSTGTAARAAGGAGGGDNGGDGGAGGVGTAGGASGPVNGGDGKGADGGGGGGGGAAGRILLRGVSTCTVDSGSISSPGYTKTGGKCP